MASNRSGKTRALKVSCLGAFFLVSVACASSIGSLQGAGTLEVVPVVTITSADMAGPVLCGGSNIGLSRLTDPRMAIDPRQPNRIMLTYMSTEPYGLFAAFTDDRGETWSHWALGRQADCPSSPGAFNLFGDQDVSFAGGGEFTVVAVEGIMTERQTIPGKEIRASSFLPGGQKLGDVGMQVVSYTFGADKTWTRTDVTAPDRLQYLHTAMLDFDKESNELLAIWAAPANPFAINGENGYLPDNAIYTGRSSDAGRTWSTFHSIPIEPWIGQQVWDIDFLSRSEAALHLNDNEHVLTQKVRGSTSFASQGKFPLKNPILPLYPFADGSVFAGDRPLAAAGDTIYQVAAPLSAAQQEHIIQFLQQFVSDEPITIPVVFQGETGERNQLQLSRSDDRGKSWSSVFAIPGATSGVFHAHVSLAEDGSVGVLWYDMRNDKAGDGALTTQVFFAVSKDKGQTWISQALSDEFDMKSAPLYIYSNYLGNYQSLEASPDGGFWAAFAVPSGGPNSSEIRVVKIIQ